MTWFAVWTNLDGNGHRLADSEKLDNLADALNATNPKSGTSSSTVLLADGRWVFTDKIVAVKQMTDSEGALL